MTRLVRHLAQRLAAQPRAPLQVGFSGGTDSTALLHALAMLPEAREGGLRALHVAHGLHPDSNSWQRHCADFCATLDVPFDAVAVSVAQDCGHGIETAARHARLRTFAQRLGPGERLLLAHHRGDQAETVLLKLLRGAGPEGVAGMRECRPLGAGLLWRPLLDTPRDWLLEHVQVHGLRVIEDPSNHDDRHPRSRLRSRVVPPLRSGWPEFEQALLHSARHLREASDYIEQQAAIALAQLQGLDPATLDWRGWLQLQPAPRDAALRQWLRSLGLEPPGQQHVNELVRQLRSAPASAVPCVSYGSSSIDVGPGVELRRYRSLLYAMPRWPAPTAGWSLTWDGAEPPQLPRDFGQLWMEPAVRLPVALRVTPRNGGERIQLAGRRHHSEVRDLLQTLGVPPWQRVRLPYVFDEAGELLAVADRIIGAALQQHLDAAGCCLRWSPASSPAEAIFP